MREAVHLLRPADRDRDPAGPIPRPGIVGHIGLLAIGDRVIVSALDQQADNALTCGVSHSWDAKILSDQLAGDLKALSRRVTGDAGGTRSEPFCADVGSLPIRRWLSRCGHSARRQDSLACQPRMSVTSCRALWPAGTWRWRAAVPSRLNQP